MNLLEMQGIVKEFPGVRAVDHVDFSVTKGEIHALLGENGAGKTTAFNCITGVYEPTNGRIPFLGFSGAESLPKSANLMKQFSLELAWCISTSCWSEN